MNNGLKIYFAETEQDFLNVYLIRKAVFGKEQGYFDEDLQVYHNPNELYLLCEKDGKIIGTQTYEIGRSFGDITFEHCF